MAGMTLLLNFQKLVTVLLVVLFTSSILLATNGSRAFNHESLATTLETVEDFSIAEPETVWDNLSKGLKLNHRAESQRVKAEIRKLLADKDEFNRVMRAAGPYIYYIFQQTKDKNLPAELALIPVIESEFNPNDHSKVGALGLWQLMPRTAKDLGVNIKEGYDGRKSVVSSTKAALLYFRDLGNTFKGDWYLAMAAYNCGEYKIVKAKKHAGSNSYWDLKLPRETELYVPKLLAVAAIVKNPKKYGVTLPHINNQPYFAELKTSKSVNLDEIANATHIEMKTMKVLNPDYGRSAQPNREGLYTLLVPATKVEEVKAHLAKNVVNT